MPKSIRILSPIFTLLTALHLGAQELQRSNIPFSVDDRELSMPLAGGLNAPQYSRVSLDADSIPDLVIFDRSGHKILPFIGTENGLEYAPELEQQFPALESWMLMRDFNGDGFPDIFSFSKTGAPGIDVYKGESTSEGLSFELMNFDNGVGVLGYPTAVGGITNIYVSAIDIPAIADVDGDGDLDILSFQSEGTQVVYYQNLVADKSLPQDTFDFILGDRCWGKFVEAFNTNDVVLSNDPDVCPDNFRLNRNGLHSGSTVTAFDADLDGDQDLLLGDISFETLLFLSNGGNADKAFMTAAIQNFPSYDQSVDIPFFPTAYIDDFDGDGLQDMIAAPNQEDSRENINVSWFYQGSVNQVGIRFNLQSRKWLVNEMLDFGTDAAPLLADITGDGRLDLLVGSRFEENYDNAFPSQLFLFENTGTRREPAFTLLDDNWLSLKDHVAEIDALKPTMADIDQDGDQDLIIGNKRGKLIFVENVSVAGTMFTPGEITYPWFDIDVGFASAPVFADLDVDGDLDLLVGEERGNINLFINSGTVTAPLFDPDPMASGNLERFGDIDARQDRAVFGAAAPTVFESGDTTFLVVGTALGNFLTYDLYQTDDTLIEMTSSLALIQEGQRSQLTMADLNSDGFLDAMTGSSRGGLVFFETNMRIGSSVANHNYDDQLAFQIFPIPAMDQLHIISESVVEHVEVFDLEGRSHLKLKPDQRKISLNVNFLTAGIYLVKARAGKRLRVKKWIKL